MPLLTTRPPRAATTGVPSGAAKSLPACISQLPSTGCRRKPKPLLIAAGPISGNRSRRLPLPATGEGRGVMANTLERLKLPSAPAMSADTGTVRGVLRGWGPPPSLKPIAASSPAEGKGAWGSPGPCRAGASLPFLPRQRTTTPLVHSCSERAPLLQAFWWAGDCWGVAVAPVRMRCRSAGLTTPWRTSSSRDWSKRRGWGAMGWAGRASWGWAWGWLAAGAGLRGVAS